MGNKVIITIGREYGSGGRTIGKMVAEKLGINFFDYEIIDETAKESGFSVKFIDKTEQRAANSFLDSIALGTPYGMTTITGRREELSLETQLFLVQCDVVKRLAEKGSCVIVGRCADYILREEKNLFRVFIYADMEKREKRIVEQYDILKKNAETELLKADKKRAHHYHIYTEQKWGDRKNYDLMINSGAVGIENGSDFIVNAVKDMFAL